MKQILVFSLFLLMISCGKSETEKEDSIEDNYKAEIYDTIAVDSFSQGAVSADVARKIKMSSVAYQDSLKEVRKKIEAEKLLKKEKEENEKTSKKIEEDLKKAEGVKVKKEKTVSESSGTNQ